MKSELRFQVLVSVASLAMSLLTGYAFSATASNTLASPESFAAISDRQTVGRHIHRAWQGAYQSALRELPSGRRPPASG
jgi:hypothetical protein